jgi:hypothetical protein
MLLSTDHIFSDHCVSLHPTSESMVLYFLFLGPREYQDPNGLAFAFEPFICFCFEENFNLKSNELAITPIELKPMRAPAIDGVSMVPVTGSNIPAAIGSPTCKKAQMA